MKDIDRPRPAPAGTAALPSLGRIRRSAARWIRVLVVTATVMSVVIWASLFERSRHERQVALAAAAQRDGNLASAVERYVLRILKNGEVVGKFVADAQSTGSTGDALRRIVATRTRLNDAFAGIGVCIDGSDPISSNPGGSDGSPVLTQELCRALEQEAARTPNSLGIGRTVGASGDSPVTLLWPGERGLVVLFARARTLLGMLQSMELPERTEVLLTGPDGAVRLQWSSRSRGLVVPDAVSRAIANADADAPEAADWLLQHRPVEGYPMRVTVAIAQADALADAWSRQQVFFMLAVLATAAVTALTLMLVRQLRLTASSMQSLARSQRRLARLNQRLEDLVAARTRDLQAANRDLEAFSYTVAHDVRAPLAAIASFSQALEPVVAASGNPRAAHHLSRVMANARQMGEMTESLLSLARISREPPTQRPVDLSTMAREILQDLQQGEPQRHAQIHVEDGIVATGDSPLLRQMLENILGNAWKFSSRRETARIDVQRMDAPAGQTGLLVRDNGAGFDSASARDLFRPFMRQHRADDFPGTGVGLASVHRIVTAHGGTVRILSSPDQGTTIMVTLPAA